MEKSYLSLRVVVVPLACIFILFNCLRADAFLVPATPTVVTTCQIRRANRPFLLSLLSSSALSRNKVSSSSAIPLRTDSAPSWDKLREELLATPEGRELQHSAEERTVGLGQPHVDAEFRLFRGLTEEESQVPVTFYRDQSAWCPYCQKVWIFLEEKQIPYRVTKVPLNAYGDKPAWFTRLVDGGKLPAMEFNGTVYTESLQMIELLERSFSSVDDQDVVEQAQHPVIIPPQFRKRIDELFELSNQLQRDWFSLVFYPVEEGEALDNALDNAKQNLRTTLQRVNDALGGTPGPWFLGGEHPSLVDIEFIPLIERLVASVLFWKGIQIRSSSSSSNHHDNNSTQQQLSYYSFPNMDAWLTAWEARPSYRATKADYYSLIMAIPSQNGPGYFSKDSKLLANQIFGLDGAWGLPFNLTNCVEQPLVGYTITTHDMTGNIKQDTYDYYEAMACKEAAYKLISNHRNICWFACRGAGEPGRPSFHAELADPYAEPNLDYLEAVDICLRHVTHALLVGTETAQRTCSTDDLRGKGGDGTLRENWEAYQDEDDGSIYYWNYETGVTTWTPPTKQLDTCLMYLRDRIGVPRDMSAPAAFLLRAHLNWAISILNE